MESNLSGSLSSKWNSVKLSNENVFSFENGIWTGKRCPFMQCKIVRNTNFSGDGYLDLSDVAEISIEKRKLEKKRLLHGDIIIERSGGGPQQPVGRVAFFDLEEGDFCFSNFTSRLRVIDKNLISPLYLNFYLLYFYISGQTEMLQRRTTGIRNLDIEAYKNLSIPLPPLPEQRAIARALHAVQGAREARLREVALERERKAALMEHLFTHGTRGEATRMTEIGEMPESWKVVKFEKVIASSAYGPRFSSDFYDPDGNVATLRTTDLDNEGQINYSTMPLAKLDLESFEHHFLKSSDFLITRSGTCGIAAIFESFEKPVLPGAFLIRFRLSDEINPQFLKYYVNSAKGRNRILQLAGGAVQKNLSGTSLRGFQIPLPILAAEQDAIVRCLIVCDSKIAALSHEARLLQELFRAVLEELMSGRLPAGALVEYAD